MPSGRQEEYSYHLSPSKPAGAEESEVKTRNQERIRRTLPVVLPRAATLVNDGFEKTLISWERFEFKPIIPVTFRGVSNILAVVSIFVVPEKKVHLQMAILSLFFPFPKGHPGFTLPLIIIAVFDYLGLAGDTRLLQAYVYINIYIEDT